MPYLEQGRWSWTDRRALSSRHRRDAGAAASPFPVSSPADHHPQSPQMDDGGDYKNLGGGEGYTEQGQQAGYTDRGGDYDQGGGGGHHDGGGGDSGGHYEAPPREHHTHSNPPPPGYNTAAFDHPLGGGQGVGVGVAPGVAPGPVGQAHAAVPDARPPPVQGRRAHQGGAHQASYPSRPGWMPQDRAAYERQMASQIQPRDEGGVAGPGAFIGTAGAGQSLFGNRHAGKGQASRITTEHAALAAGTSERTMAIAEGRAAGRAPYSVRVAEASRRPSPDRGGGEHRPTHLSPTRPAGLGHVEDGRTNYERGMASHIAADYGQLGPQTGGQGRKGDKLNSFDGMVSRRQEHSCSRNWRS